MDRSVGVLLGLDVEPDALKQVDHISGRHRASLLSHDLGASLGD